MTRQSGSAVCAFGDWRTAAWFVDHASPGGVWVCSLADLGVKSIWPTSQMGRFLPSASSKYEADTGCRRIVRFVEARSGHRVQAIRLPVMPLHQ